MDDRAASMASQASNLSRNTSLSRTSVSSLSCAILSSSHSHSAHGLDDVIRVVRTLNLQRYRYEDLSREEILGEGETYVVERCVARNENVFAVKHLKVSSDAMFHKRLRSVILELQIMRHPPFKAHPNIMPGLGYGWNTKGNIIMTYLVVEYAGLGTLREHITTTKPPLPDIEILLGDVASGLVALHTCGIVHGDMKLDNVLVFPSMDRPAKALARVADFGHALVLNNTSSNHDGITLVYSGTLIYNAPEVEEQSNYPIDRADLPKCDIWALGLLVWEACIGGKEYLSHLRENQLSMQAMDSNSGFDSGDLLEFAKRSLPKSQLGPAMFLRIALHKTLQKDPTMRAPDARSLPLYTRWNSNNASGLQARLALHMETPTPTYEILRLDNNKDIPWAHQQQIFQSMEQTFQDRLAKETGQIMWQIALCYHVGFGTARDAREAFEFARMAKSSGHPVAAIFSHLLGSPEELGPHQNRDSYATRVLTLLRSDPAASAGMPALVEAFYRGDGPMVHSLFDQTACLCSSATDGCGPLHWLFAFQDEKALDGIVDRLLKTDDGHLTALVNLPFSAPREIHCQWPLKLFGSPLAVAISVNSLITVKALLALGADPFLHIYYEAKPHPEDQGQRWTAFHVAAKYHCSEILQYLVEHSDSGRHAGLSPLGCALSFSTSLERLAMHGLGRMEHLDRTVQIIRSIQSLTAVASNGMTALMQAIDFQDHDVAASLLRAAPELANTPFFSPRDKQVFNLPIHFAAQIASQCDSPDALEIPDLINSYTRELRVSVAPARDHAGRTPLHLASTGPSNRIATWILQRKSNLLPVEDTWGRIPLHYCTSATTCKLLLQQGASVDHTDKLGMTALHRASLDGASELVVSLLEARPKLELDNNKYGTPLHCGVISGSVDVVLTLIEAGALIDATDRMGNTAVHVAARLGRHQILRILMRSGADTALQNIRGRDARSIASDERRRATTGILLILNANVGPASKRKQNHLKPVGDWEVTGGEAQHPREEGSDFLWTKEEVMARDGGEDTDSLPGFVSEQGDSDDHQDDDPEKDASRTHETVMTAVYNTLQSNPLNPSINPSINTSVASWTELGFVDSIVESSLAFVESCIWQPDRVGRAIIMMAQTANSLVYALLASLMPRDLGPLSSLVDLDNNEGDCPLSEARTDNQRAFTLMMGMMISHMAHLAVSTKPGEIWPGRGQREVAHMIHWEARRLGYYLRDADGITSEIKLPQRHAWYRSEPRPSSKYFEWKYRNAERDAETELGQQEDTIQSRQVGAHGDLNKLISPDEPRYHYRQPKPHPPIDMLTQTPGSFEPYPLSDEPTPTRLGSKGGLLGD